MREDDDWLFEEMLHGAPRSSMRGLRGKIRVCGAEFSTGSRIGEGAGTYIHMMLIIDRQDVRSWYYLDCIPVLFR